MASHEHEALPDWSNQNDMKEALSQCSGAILAASGCEDNALNCPGLLSREWLQCEQNIASVVSCRQQILKLSWTNGFVEKQSVSAIGKANWELEQELQKTFYEFPFNLTIIRASTGMDTFLQGRLHTLIRGRTLSMSVKTGRIAFVHPLDIAECLSAILSLNKRDGFYKFTGPEAFSFQEVAKILSEGIGDTVTFSYFPLWAVQPARWVQGVPGDVTEEELGVLRALEAGAQDEVETSGMEKLMGHKPRTFREFVLENSDKWPRADPY
ncbi:hypothetical protein CCR75_007829 [Bremia lactucae]|uniref:NmrA-like domain-containing protein n=1 Tax=Bremia lactucae TaxID=4779 RepID=A0A976FH87_BRELC|nr:hypothetical protein CCR75_007829 [Bremia lactucae]